ncbi:MAG TPA: LPS-assembly protein LptD [Gallionella sp.]|jgi:LPS-assembly protein|nr:LPS-assembly protein LptD [Gallionella sp.]
MVMRFRLKSIIFFLFCIFAQQAGADAGLPVLGVDKTLKVMTPAAQETPIFVEADRLTGKKKNQLEATGNAVLRKRGQSIRADQLVYFQDTQELDAQGSVVLEQDGNTMSGPHLKLNLDTSIGTMEQPVYYLAENAARGAADVLHIQDRQHYTLENATYTTCPADDEDWLLKMGSLEIDRDRQIGSAHHARVEFMGLPILYSPWMDFPLNDQRKSGFLAPVLGGTTKGGSELTLPYYWNIAPNRDATIAPRVMTKRGVMLNNEFRYLEAGYGGEAHVDVLPDDMLANRSRTHFAVMHSQAVTDQLSGYVNLNRVSDDAYFRDLSDTVNTTSQVNLVREGALNYNAEWWDATVRIQRYQTLQDPAEPIAAPYARVPQLNLSAQQNHSGAAFAFAGEFVEFSHPTELNGGRLVLNPSVSYPLWSDSAFYLTPKVALHSTYYAMGRNNTGALQDTSRTLPIYSVDSGMAFERDESLFGGDYVHTLEPRAFYVYVPYKDQTALPNFDTAQADFSFTQMFTENRFFGSDRVGDANHITLAMTSRLLEQSNGMERLKVTVGERFSYSAPRVNLVTPAASTSRSDILLAVAGRVTDAWSLDSEFQFDPNQSQTQRYNIAARFRPEPGKAVNFGYRFARNTLRQIDVSTQWPLSSRWRAVGRWNYSLQDAQILEAMVGLEYNQSCWALRLVAQQFTVGAQQINTGFFMQLELNDFLKVGSDALGVLRQSVPGYTKMNDKPVNPGNSVLR